tara:strand:- start:1151 stop:1303 length:153 start_codon:yes stop_codon:yes gene_type:complete
MNRINVMTIRDGLIKIHKINVNKLPKVPGAKGIFPIKKKVFINDLEKFIL